MAKEQKTIEIFKAEDLKPIFTALNSALVILQEKVTALGVIEDSQKAIGAKLNEDQAAQAKRFQELNNREENIKHIEDIVALKAEAQKLMAEAKTLLKNAEDRDKKAEKGLKVLAEGQSNLEKEKASFLAEQKNQIEAFRKEKSAFDAKVRAAEAMAKSFK